MTSVRDAEDAVSYAVVREVCEGREVAVASTRTDTHHVVGFALEMTRHPSGVREIPPPVVVSFQREHWVRIAICLKHLERRA